ncbi:DnaJ C-terminal domain-containing protein [Cryptosporangium arvum]|uniref:DnaJ-class molecular chaperone with C-terminal Zn finger domain n=1 Tax=Cryptosporangium arvum DSM 44712 TaxID=927661 RepID=A0A010YPQ2_9ACTN|nr:DnaJ C-terminal domain-containing protein [Cryptosporangium arvum]EXG82165.1 DnaJ-class molecular chaperone with C-terminal Zn finger domain [Cryptosporangium arvum DSM 44712]
MAPSRDFYATLGVARDVSADDMQRAYRKLARTYHPDVNKDPGAEERFKDISEAYDVLSDPEQRHRYDAFGPDFRDVPPDVDPQARARAGADGGRTRGSRGERGGRARRGGGPPEDVYTRSGGFQDIDFESMFGGVFGGRSDGGFGPIPGADQEAEIELTVEEAHTGGRRTVTLSGPDGSRTLNVTIPPGVTDGQRIRLSGQGGRGGDGATDGDLYLVVRLAPHPRYRVAGRDITATLPLTPWEAALGASVAVETPAGEARVRVPAGTPSGRRLRLAGRGLPNPRGRPGDLYAEARIMVPPEPSDEERRLFEQLAAVSTFDPRGQ